MDFNEIYDIPKNKMVALSICRAADKDILIPALRLVKEQGITVHLIDDSKILTEQIKAVDESFLFSDYVVCHHINSDKEAAHKAVTLAAKGTCNILMKGMIPTSVILREVLQKEHDLLNHSLLSHIALIDLPNYHKAILLSDAAMNINPDTNQLKGIINNAVNTAHYLNITHPKIALLAAVEKVNDKIEATVKAEKMTEWFEGSEGFTVEGPLQYDLAVSKKAAQAKRAVSQVAGDADILIAPEINAGNVLYKSLVYSAGARVAAMITGAKIPIVLTSRSDSGKDKYNSICLAIYSINSNILNKE